MKENNKGKEILKYYKKIMTLIQHRIYQDIKGYV